MKTQAQIEEETGMTGIGALSMASNNAFDRILNMFENCQVANPLFNAPELGDYTLQPLSPARNASYDGTYIGCYDIAFPTYAFADDTGKPNAFYNASKNQNTIVANNSISLVRNNDGSAVGSGLITEKPKDLDKIYELKGNRGCYVVAARNGEALDSSADIDRNNPIATGTTLTAGKIYINEIGAVTYNGTTYPIRSRIMAVDSIQTFTTTEGGVLFEILETPNRFTNEVRFKQNISGVIVNAGTNLTVNSWYRVINDSITWNGETLPVGDSFQAIAGQLTFAGNGAVIEEFSDADVWRVFVIDSDIKIRRVGDVASGNIDTGTDGKPMTNAHGEYYSAQNVVRPEFSVYARYVQKRWTLNAGMSK
ncbi:MAG: hypothetical protein LBV41_04815 [Cytophagaceae bacterium]|nr:hypothetical protein [Cytophagaceae bacterium]